MSTQLSEVCGIGYEEFAKQLPGATLPWMNELRGNALEHFNAKGFPSPREEDWRYTNVTFLESRRFVPFTPSASLDLGVARSLLDAHALAGAHRLVFVNGHFVEPLSSLQDLPDRVVVASVAERLGGAAEWTEGLFARSVAPPEHPFVAFNTACFADGACIDVPAGVDLARPVQCLFIVTVPEVLANVRNLVRVGSGARVRVVETFVGLASDAYLAASVTEAVLAENAELEWTKLQVEGARAHHFGGLYASQARDARLRIRSYAFGGLLARTELVAALAQGAECSMDGLFVARGNQHQDHHTRIDHRECHGISRETFAGVVDDVARGVFQGRIVVHPDAQKTDAQMSCRNLLLSTGAEVDAKPQLEIHADDVKCSHGVTIGQLSDDAVFYLQSRGLDVDTARNVLTFGFANAMVESLTDEAVRQLVHKQLWRVFPDSYEEERVQ